VSAGLAQGSYAAARVDSNLRPSKRKVANYLPLSQR